jgi:hypothetical protein
MGLKEKAIEAFEIENESITEANMRKTEKFAENALQSLKDVIGNDYDIGNDCNIDIVDKQSWATSFIVDDLLFRVSASEVHLVQTCPRCQAEITDRVLDIKDIGKALVRPHNKYDCDRITESRMKEEKEKNGVVLGTDERLLEALRDFIRENDHMCSSY